MSSTGDRTRRVVEGALGDCIRTHGPITANLVESATKRLVAQLRAASETAHVYNPDDTGDQRGRIDSVYKRLEKLRYGHAILVSQHEQLRAKYAELQQVAADAEERCMKWQDRAQQAGWRWPEEETAA